MRPGPLTDERGAVLLWMALALPVIVLLLAMAMDFGNWYVHKRQLQNRVDAAAFAAGVEYGQQFARCANASTRPAAEAAIVAAAKKYAGAPGVSGGFNTTPGDASNQLSIVINDGADNPCFRHPANGEFPSPLGGYWTDVRAVAGEVPSFFAGFGVPKPEIAASARVAVMTAETVGGMRPLGLVSASSTSCVSAAFVGAGTVTLTGGGTGWSGTAPNMPTNNSAVSITVGCGSNATTYDNLAYVTRVQVGSLPQLTNLVLAPLSPGTCTNDNPYFIPHDGSSCQMRVTATVTFPAVAPQKSVRVTPGSGSPIVLTNSSGNDWTGILTIAPGSGTGADGLQNLVITARSSSSQSYNTIGTGAVQAGTAADQGPIANVTLTRHAQASLQPIGTITVTLRGLSSDDLLVVESAVDCNPEPGSNLAREFEDGCPGPFRVSASPSDCQNSVRSPSNPAGPFDCVAGPGQSIVSLSNGNPSEYTSLWAPGSTCSAKNWPDPQDGDPRLITVFLSDAIPDNQNASEDYRITGFAAFYVTGWDNSPSRCNGENDAKPPGTPNGSVWGHVLASYVLPPGSGTASQTPCTLGAGEVCIAALVK